MRKILLAGLLCISLLMSAGSALAEDTFISINGSTFKPGSDYSTSWESSGVGGGLSYTMINEYAGFEFGLNGYAVDDPENKTDLSSMGLELLIHFQKPDSWFSPFVALGFSRYKTTLTTTSTIGDIEESSAGGGGVLKVGARVFIKDNYYIGAYYKTLKNKVDLGGGEVDVGGSFVCVELGIVNF